jgi:Fe2+ or Zn2+ uptake regulation protein
VDAPGTADLSAERYDERAAVALRAAGLRVTRPRLAVHRALAHLGGHRSADDVAATLDAAEASLPRTSVYNALEALRGAGVVKQMGAGTGAALYEVATDWHHHFVCRRCGDVADVPCPIGVKPCMKPEVPGAEVDEAEVIYRGLCPQCVAKDDVTGPTLLSAPPASGSAPHWA